MEDVVTQPYDKITPAMQQRYYEASPYNLVRVILGKQFPDDTEDDNVYTRAAEYLHDWRKNRVLAEESEPALYGYTQTYTVPGSTEVRERRGFIALGHLYDYAAKVVYRHEQTFPQPKSDRLALFKTTRAYCEQIYMLYSDPAFTAEKLIFGSGDRQSPADLVITDEYGVVHKVWKLTDPILINLIVTAMATKSSSSPTATTVMRPPSPTPASAPFSSVCRSTSPATKTSASRPATCPCQPSPRPP